MQVVADTGNREPYLCDLHAGGGGKRIAQRIGEQTDGGRSADELHLLAIACDEWGRRRGYLGEDARYIEYEISNAIDGRSQVRDEKR